MNLKHAGLNMIACQACSVLCDIERCVPCRLTDPLGQHLAELPVDPRLGKALLASGELGCAEEVLTIVALLSVQSVWLSPHGQGKALDAAKSKSVISTPSHLPLDTCSSKNIVRSDRLI